MFLDYNGRPRDVERHDHQSYTKESHLAESEHLQSNN